MLTWRMDECIKHMDIRLDETDESYDEEQVKLGSMTSDWNSICLHPSSKEDCDY